MLTRPIFWALGALVLAAVILAACSGQPAATDIRAQMPEHIHNAPERVVASYEYAALNMDELAKYPCYCGCGNMGHTSNLSCYVQAVSGDGRISWDNHALGCGICVDIAQDVMRLKGEGWASRDVRQYIDSTYGSFGPGTNTPYPQS